MKKSFLKYVLQYGTPGHKNAHVKFRVPGDLENVAFNMFRHFAFMSCVRKVSSEGFLVEQDKRIRPQADELVSYYDVEVIFREDEKHEGQIISIIDKIKF